MSFFDLATLIVFILLAPHFTKPEALTGCWLLIGVEVVLVALRIFA
jgi:hypothetical protein